MQSRQAGVFEFPVECDRSFLDDLCQDIVPGPDVHEVGLAKRRVDIMGPTFQGGLHNKGVKCR